jgi:hypothetical protein
MAAMAKDFDGIISGADSGDRQVKVVGAKRHFVDFECAPVNLPQRQTTPRGRLLRSNFQWPYCTSPPVKTVRTMRFIACY